MRTLPTGGGVLAQRFEVWPGRLRVDVVRGDRRNAAPVVQPGGDQLWVVVITEVRRRLDVHLGAEDDAADGDGPEQVIEVRLRSIRHFRVGLRAEVLDDDFLDVPELFVQTPQAPGTIRCVRAESRRCR